MTLREGEIAEVSFARALYGRVIAVFKINGRVGVPHGGGPQPSPGTRWRVQFVGYNEPKDTVAILYCLEEITPPKKGASVSMFQNPVTG
jgi:hypothetical protein